jgi:hypothetical protein
MNTRKKMRSFGAGLLTLTLMGSLAAGPQLARADDPPPKDKSAGKKDKKQDSIPIKIVPPIIVPDKGKDGKDNGKQGK